MACAAVQIVFLGVFLLTKSQETKSLATAANASLEKVNMASAYDQAAYDLDAPRSNTADVAVPATKYVVHAAPGGLPEPPT